jgi:DNA-binding transcriptional ArsR family regulator
MPNQAVELNRVFHALADPTRRGVLEQLGSGPASMSRLAQPFQMALPSFSQHLDVLQECGLVQSRKTGRVRTFQLAPQRLKVAEHWMVTQRAKWQRRLDQLDDYLQVMKEQKR